VATTPPTQTPQTAGSAPGPDAGTRRRLDPAQRKELEQRLGARYAEGASIRAIAEEEGCSYGFVHRLLTDGGTALRGRGGSTRRPDAS
jgi:hypothetical protein